MPSHLNPQAQQSLHLKILKVTGFWLANSQAPLLLQNQFLYKKAFQQVLTSLAEPLHLGF